MQIGFLLGAQIVRDFGPEVIQYKPLDENFEQQYVHLLRASDPVVETCRGRIDALIVLKNKNLIFLRSIGLRIGEMLRQVI